jgi:hypothetical protein
MGLMADGSEDCLPPTGEIEAVGATLPEFEILGYPETKQAYYIRCYECVEKFQKPKDVDEHNWVTAWNRDLKAAQGKWNREKVEEVEETDKSAVAGGTREMVDLITPSPIKMEVSSSEYTMTTEAEDFSNGNIGAVVQELSFGRDVIVID